MGFRIVLVVFPHPRLRIYNETNNRLLIEMTSTVTIVQTVQPSRFRRDYPDFS